VFNYSSGAAFLPRFFVLKARVLSFFPLLLIFSFLMAFQPKNALEGSDGYPGPAYLRLLFFVFLLLFSFTLF
jgi:hypothetical protein